MNGMHYNQEIMLFQWPDYIIALPSSLSNDGVNILPKDSADYGQMKTEFDSLFAMKDPAFDESNYKQFVNMAM